MMKWRAGNESILSNNESLFVDLLCRTSTGVCAINNNSRLFDRCIICCSWISSLVVLCAPVLMQIETFSTIGSCQLFL